ncbi:hypothetical protein JD78_03247 [Modestobacter roseus]|uniref:UGSC-like domain-containing protein n=1 Tax=Modestobacter roseus TaxID=1181884 RepID=A0A562IUT1_9ACTN|nr:hypothetical protein [Modestobacter roseus]MQA32848.1 hypothetical protein [Modestobacter roseus]TWH74702.1 hypothetical protein JD78_03247 [Modestobacter roseus]
MADGILLERAGVPAVSVCTDAFRITGAAMASGYGFPGYEYVSLPHPVASLTAEQIRERVTAALPQVLEILGVEE